ncbi:MAG: hypothetical protein ACRDJM_09725 [Actinomycetota bacterium]
MIPTVEDLASSPLVHRFGDHFNPPALTNFLGCVQAEVDLTSIRCLSFPPLSTGDTVTAALFLNGRYFPSLGVPVTFTWYPDRIVREAEWDGWRIRTTTALPFGRTAVILFLEAFNRAGGERELDVRLALRGGVTNDPGPWTRSPPPMEDEHEIGRDAGRGAIRFVAKRSGAVSVQGCRPAPRFEAAGALAVTLRVPPAGSATASFVAALGATAAAAEEAFDALIDRVPQQIASAREEWDREIEAVFTPGNDRYGGHLPLLETSEDAVRRTYLMGAIGTVYFRREGPLGRTYDTLMPRYWQTVTYLWDYSLSSMVHAMLDPHVMRRMLELWMARDVHTCFGTERLTGGPVGVWYAVNDYAMAKMIGDYVTWSGDRPWLHASVSSRTVAEHLRDYATAWRGFRTPSGLADFGGIGSLLECVSTYVHEIAALNAGSVYAMRLSAEVSELLGDGARASALREEAAALVAGIQSLYVAGAGYWNTRRPDGSLVPVRHAYDFITVLATIAGDLSDAQKKEMALFCERELMTPAWMRALSREDPDAVFDTRPDHQWTGAYTAWPPQAVQALYRAGRAEAGLEWLRGMARSANQGPFGQAQFAEDALEPDAGGARKSSSDFPWICDWACSSNGAWVNVVVESIFGVRAGFEGIDARPQFGSFDPHARLRNVAWQGSLYDCDARGIRRVQST